MILPDKGSKVFPPKRRRRIFPITRRGQRRTSPSSGLPKGYRCRGWRYRQGLFLLAAQWVPNNRNQQAEPTQSTDRQTPTHAVRPLVDQLHLICPRVKRDHDPVIW